MVRLNPFDNPDPANTDPVYVAIDPSIRHCGFAIARPESQDLICASGVISPNEKDADLDRIVSVSDILWRIVDHWPVEFLVVEIPTSLYVKQKRSMEALKVLLPIGAVAAIAAKQRIPVLGVTVRQWKGGGKQYKADSMRLGRALWPDLRPVGEDEMEARLLALWVVQPKAVQAAIYLAKIEAPLERCVGVIKREWFWGQREFEKLTSLAAGNRLLSFAGKR